MVKKWYRALVIVATTITHAQNPLPFTIPPITITSSTLSLMRKTHTADALLVHYTGELTISIGELASARADHVYVTLHNMLFNESFTMPTLDENMLALCKRISVRGNVHVQTSNRTMCADALEIVPNQQRAYLRGNVQLAQQSTNNELINVAINAHYAALDLATFSATLKGSRQRPVSTCVDLKTIIQHYLPSYQAKETKQTVTS